MVYVKIALGMCKLIHPCNVTHYCLKQAVI